MFFTCHSAGATQQVSLTFLHHLPNKHLGDARHGDDDVLGHGGAGDGLDELGQGQMGTVRAPHAVTQNLSALPSPSGVLGAEPELQHQLLVRGFELPLGHRAGIHRDQLSRNKGLSHGGGTAPEGSRGSPQPALLGLLLPLSYPFDGGLGEGGATIHLVPVQLLLRKGGDQDPAAERAIIYSRVRALPRYQSGPGGEGSAAL